MPVRSAGSSWRRCSERLWWRSWRCCWLVEGGGGGRWPPGPRVRWSGLKGEMRMMWSRWWLGRRRPTAGNEGYEGKESKLICTAKDLCRSIHRSTAEDLWIDLKWTTVWSVEKYTEVVIILQGALQCPSIFWIQSMTAISESRNRQFCCAFYYAKVGSDQLISQP